MFLPGDHSKTASTLPRNCSLSKNDWEILAGLWHPVAFSGDIGHKPVAAKLLDVPLVIYRTSSGITVAKDLCVHRGTPLSLGWLKDDMIVCPMHALHYDAEGRCRLIPSVEDKNRPISERLRLITFQSVERYGIIWVCLLNDEPGIPLPEWPDLESDRFAADPEIKKMAIDEIWNCSASRHTENFNDAAHLSWVHANSFGNPEQPEVHEIEVDTSIPYVLKRVRRLAEKTLGQERLSHFTAELTLPFSSALVEKVGNGNLGYAIYDAACPMSASETRIFQIIWSGFPDSYPHSHVQLWEQVNREDIALVSRQSPEEVPLDVREEIHIPADAVSLAYRKAMKELGLGAPRFIK